MIRCGIRRRWEALDLGVQIVVVSLYWAAYVVGLRRCFTVMCVDYFSLTSVFLFVILAAAGYVVGGSMCFDPCRRVPRPIMEL